VIGLLKGAIKNLGAAINMPVKIVMVRNIFKPKEKDQGKEKDFYWFEHVFTITLPPVVN